MRVGACATACEQRCGKGACASAGTGAGWVPVAERNEGEKKVQRGLVRVGFLVGVGTLVYLVLWLFSWRKKKMCSPGWPRTPDPPASASFTGLRHQSRQKLRFIKCYLRRNCNDATGPTLAGGGQNLRCSFKPNLPLIQTSVRSTSSANSHARPCL